MGAFIFTGVFQFTNMIPMATVMIAYPIIFCVWKFFYTGFQYLPDVMMNFVPDVDEMITLRRREGVYSAAQRLVQKLLQAIVTTVLGYILLSSGFISTAKGQTVEQPISVPITISLTYTFGCVALFLVSAILGKFVDLDKKSCEIVSAEVQRIREGGLMKDVDPEVKKVCEKMTGYKYEQCFAHNTVGYQDGSVIAAA